MIPPVRSPVLPDSPERTRNQTIATATIAHSEKIPTRCMFSISLRAAYIADAGARDERLTNGVGRPALRDPRRTYTILHI
jgi:hypothetical protein